MIKMDVSIEELKRICLGDQEWRYALFKSAPHVFWYDWYVGRRISIRLTYLLVKTNITPNQVSIASMAIGLIGGVIFLFGSYWHSIIGAVFLQGHMILDMVDGEMARYKKLESIEGKYLDYLSTDLVFPLSFFTIGLGLYLNPYRLPSVLSETTWVLFLGYTASFSFLLISLTFYLSEYFIFKRQASILLGNKLEGIREREFYEPIIQEKKTIENERKRLKTLQQSRLASIWFMLNEHVTMLAAILVAAVVDKLYIVILFYGLVLPVLAISRFYAKFIDCKVRAWSGKV